MKIKKISAIILITTAALSAIGINGGARSAALGNSGVALADSLSGIVLNPALVTTIDTFSVSATAGLNNLGLSGVSLTEFQGSLAIPLKKVGVFGAYINTLIAGNKDNGQSDTVMIHLQEQYGRQFKNVAVAVSSIQKLMIVNKPESFDGTKDDVKADPSFGIGISLFYQKEGKIDYGIAVDNLFSELLSPGDTLPIILRTGIAMTMEKGTVYVDGKLQKDLGFGSADIFLSGGYERSVLNDKLSLRGGAEIKNITEGLSVTAGAGFNLKDSFLLDYVLSMPLLGAVRAWGGSHLVSLTYSF